MAKGMFGSKDMHPMQIEEFLNFCCYTLDMAHELAVASGDPEIVAEAISKVESLTEMFGMNAFILRKSPESLGSAPESDLLGELLRPRQVGRPAAREVRTLKRPASET
jgi:hypothetical protein